MKDAKEFCTCTDYKCPNHPVNHDKGCALCIQKNLRQKEIPACFFHDIDCEKPTPEWHYRDFAILVEKAGREGKLRGVIMAGITQEEMRVLRDFSRKPA